jgi:hypothetical protein
MPDESAMTIWRRSFVREHGSPALNGALESGDVSAHAAARAARWLSHEEQDRELADHPGQAFARRMAEIDTLNSGKVTREITAREWEVVQQMRAQTEPEP